MSAKVSVLGLGYLGATQAIVLAEMGHLVVGVDTDESKVRALQRGELHFYEPGLQEMLEKSLASGRLTFRCSYDQELEEVDVHFICVGTPTLTTEGEVDLSAVHSAGLSLAPFIKHGAVIVGRSTVPPGTAAQLKRILTSAISVAFYLAWNPEFLSEGSAIEDSLSPSRIVVGVDDEESLRMLRGIYEPQIKAGIPFIAVDVPTSELVKVASNSFLALKISYINGVAEIAERVGASTTALAKALGLDPRIGSRFLQNGLGFGGGCLPKDLLGFANTARELEATGLAKLLDATSEINTGKISRTISLATKKLGDLANRKVAVLGIAFKPDTDDSRESPGLKLAEELIALGCSIKIHDPVVRSTGLKSLDDCLTTDLHDTVDSAELVIVATGWKEYNSFSPKSKRASLTRLVIDGRSVINVEAWAGAGWNVIKLGEGSQL